MPNGTQGGLAGAVARTHQTPNAARPALGQGGLLLSAAGQEFFVAGVVIVVPCLKDFGHVVLSPGT